MIKRSPYETNCDNPPFTFKVSKRVPVTRRLAIQFGGEWKYDLVGQRWEQIGTSGIYAIKRVDYHTDECGEKIPETESYYIMVYGLKDGLKRLK